MIGPIQDSPPLARGALDLWAVRVDLHGLTPARTGSTTRTATSKRGNWTHPRSRGEHHHSPEVTPWSQDSPPLARGARGRAEHHHRVGGLTPARAGST